MGQFLATLLKNHAEIEVTDTLNKKHIALKLGVSWKSLEEVVKNSILFLVVPIPNFESCLISIKDLVSPHTIVIECCSVMHTPVKLMMQHLSQTQQIVGCHHLFGPQSGAKGVKNKQMVLSFIRCSDSKRILRLFDPPQLSIITLSPEEHDTIMADTQAVELFIGAMLKTLVIHPHKLTTPGFDLLLQLYEMLKDDSSDILAAVHTENPFAEKIADNLLQSAHEVRNSIWDGTSK